MGDDIGDSSPAIKVPLDEIRYTQASINWKFRCGKTLTELIMRLDQGDPECDPHKANFLLLGAIRVSGVHFSLDNRRLFCLKQHQEYQRVLQPCFKLLLRLLATVENMHALKKIQNNWDTTDNGLSIRVRR